MALMTVDVRDAVPSKENETNVALIRSLYAAPPETALAELWEWIIRTGAVPIVGNRH
jgi:hypothetical protein